MTGYDLCTGRGTPNGTNLINALAGPPILAPSIVSNSFVLMVESCPNGAVEPAETVTVNFGLKNIGTARTTNLVATLLSTGGILSPSAPRTYGVLSTNGTAVVQPFTFIATENCGVTAPALPAGWTTSTSGAQSAWVTSTSVRDTTPNSAFSPDPASVGVNELDSPTITLPVGSAQLTFHNNYNLQTTYDGGVLEIKIGGGAWTDILTAGGSFVSGGYNYTLSSSFSNPLAGRQALVKNLLPEAVFAVSQQSAQPGQTLSVQVTVSGFHQVTSAQFSLAWDPAVLRYVGTGSYGLTGLSAGSFGTTLAGSGKLAFAWYDSAAVGVALANGTVLFTASFEVIGKAGNASAVALASAPTAQEVSVDFALAAFGAQDGSVAVVGPGALVSSLGSAKGAFRLSVPTEKGRAYILEFTDALAHANWTALPSVGGRRNGKRPHGPGCH